MKTSNTNLNLYKTFVAVFETQSMGKASEALGISRAAVSQNIKTLGGQLDVVLFVTHRTGVTPTPQARKLYPTIKQALDLIADTESLLEAPDKNTGTIKIAINNLYADIQIKEYLKKFCTLYPNVKLEFFTRDGLALLEQKKIDFVIDLDVVFKNTNCKTIELFTLTGAFIASKEFLKKRGLSQTISKDDLIKLPFIARREAWPLYLQQMDAPQEPHVTIAASNDMTFSMAKNGLGVGCLSKETLAKMSDENTVTLNVKNIHLPPVKVVCGYNNLTHHARKFIEGLTTAAEAQGD